ncbi:MAG: pyridoxal 5'-phosphate synthase glutaminase subunit PdxT [Calditrichaeota bacterium]|nr:MAG: pyridoxal 5'-phosphate synthase glutaminase subunit PdxT [Calditrichota bacterium]
MKIGVLALQGDFYLHIKRLQELGVTAVEVRKPEELQDCQGLILPGGESTTLVKLMKNIGLFDAIKDFAKKYPLFGTCAGCILVSKEVTNQQVESLNLINIVTERNAYGRQIDSFVDLVKVELMERQFEIEGVFIRAPKIIKAEDSVRVLGVHGDEIVLVEEGNVLAATFHPELSEEKIIHEYFLEKVKASI